MIINNHNYILDMGNALWKIIFPPFFWIFSNTIYEVNDNKIIEELKASEQKITETDNILAGLLAILLAILLKPLGDYLDLPNNLFVNTVILINLVIIVWIFYIYLNIKCKKSLYKVIHLEEYLQKRLRVRPQSLKSFSFIMFYYLFFLAFTILAFCAFIQFPNAMVIICGMVTLFFTMFFSFMTVALGDNKVKFVNGKTLI